MRPTADHDDDNWLASTSDDEGFHGDGPGPKSTLEREAKSRAQRFWNEGFRDGVEEGKEETLQHGFNLGFREGYEAGRQWGSDRAYASALRALAAKLGTGEGTPVRAALAAAPLEPGIDRARLLLADLIVTMPSMELAQGPAAVGLEAEKTAQLSELQLAFATLRVKTSGEAGVLSRSDGAAAVPIAHDIEGGSGCCGGSGSCREGDCGTKTAARDPAGEVQARSEGCGALDCCKSADSRPD